MTVPYESARSGSALADPARGLNGRIELLGSFTIAWVTAFYNIEFHSHEFYPPGKLVCRKTSVSLLKKHYTKIFMRKQYSVGELQVFRGNIAGIP